MSFKISIAMCTYNGEKYVREQLESIINQTRRPDEIIVCDDGSTDKTVNIVKTTLCDSGIYYKIVKNSQNLGFIKNFEKAISLCTGDIIFLSDQDDFWLKNKIEKTEKVFIKDDKCMLVFSNMEIADKNLSKRGYNTWDLLGINEHLTDIDILKMTAQRKDIFNGCAMSIRSTTKEVIFPFTKNWGHDIWIIVNVALFFDNPIRLIPDKILLHRRHFGNTSKANYFDKLSILESKTFFYRLKKMKTSYQSIKKNRNYDKDRYYSFLMQAQKKQRVIDKQKETILKNVYEFWNRKANMDKRNVLVGITQIIKDLNMGLYREYQNDNYKLAAKDIIYFLLYKLKIIH